MEAFPLAPRFAGVFWFCLVRYVHCNHRLWHGQPALGAESHSRRSVMTRRSSASPSRSTRPTKSCCPASARLPMPSSPSAKNMAEPVLSHIRRGKPFLGICLGFQMLFDVGYEDGSTRVWA